MDETRRQQHLFLRLLRYYRASRYRGLLASISWSLTWLLFPGNASEWADVITIIQCRQQQPLHSFWRWSF